MDMTVNLSTGDWVVHTYYGVGQIIRIEDKPIHEVATKCFQVKTNDSTFWFPTTDTANPRIRPIASKEIIHKVINNLRSQATYLDTDRAHWKQIIQDVLADNDLISISLLIRDLSAQQVIRSLNQIEREALNHYKERLLGEWASIVGEVIEILRPRLRSYIQEGQAKLDLPEKK